MKVDVKKLLQTKQANNKELIQFQMPIDKVEQKDGVIMIEGYASTPDIDRYNDIVQTEAFKGDGMKAFLENPVVLLSHKNDKAIGIVVDHRVDDDKGLRVKAEIRHDIDSIFEQIQAGTTKAFSIGFYALAWDYVTREGKPLSDLTTEEANNLGWDDIVRIIKKLELIEISVVNVPANKQSLFTLSKALEEFFAKQAKHAEIDDNAGGDQPETTPTEDGINNDDVIIDEAVDTSDGADEESAESDDTDKKDGADDDEGTQSDDDAEADGESPSPQPDAAGNDADNGEEGKRSEAEPKTAPTPAQKASLEHVELLEKKIDAYKEIMEMAVDTIVELAEKNASLEGLVASIPVNKGFQTINHSPAEEKLKLSPLAQAMVEAKDNALGA